MWEQASYRKQKFPIHANGNPMCCFNHLVGLPTSKFKENVNEFGDKVERPPPLIPEEGSPVPLTAHNWRMLRDILSHDKSSINKCRGSGASEMFTVRWLLYYYGLKNPMPDRTGIVRAGIKKNLALEFSTRLKELADKIPEVYAVKPRGDKPDTYEFNTGGVLEYLSANESAPRGKANVGDIADEEIAFWDLVDDKEVFAAAQSLFAKSHARIVQLTTPKGKRGGYYNDVWGVENSEYYKILINWREVCGLPVRDMNQLKTMYPLNIKDIQNLRRECLYNWKHDVDGYRAWYRGVVGPDRILPIHKLVKQVPHFVIDPNAVISDYIQNRNIYDQEYDNQFVSSEFTVLGDFIEKDNLEPWNLDAMLDKYNVPGKPRARVLQDLKDGEKWV